MGPWISPTGEYLLHGAENFRKIEAEAILCGRNRCEEEGWGRPIALSVGSGKPPYHLASCQSCLLWESETDLPIASSTATDPF